MFGNKTDCILVINNRMQRKSKASLPSAAQKEKLRQDFNYIESATLNHKASGYRPRR